MEDDDDQGMPMSQVAVRTRHGSVHDFSARDLDSEDERSPEEEEAEELQGTQPVANGYHLAPSIGGSQHMQQQHQQRELSRHSKYFKDPVHGLIRMDPHILQFIDTRPFQRLRYLQQLGLSQQVFPSASHTRFEHSLGVAHLAFKYTDRIWDMQRKRKGHHLGGSIDIRHRDILTVSLAGLCHDLGHGPFSHVWDHEFCRAKGINDWTHEEMSCKMVDHIRDTHHIDSITDDEVSLIKRLILGQRHLAPDGKAFLFDIVANNRNSIDVDKIDYLPRDAMHCGVKVSCDFERLMTHSKVINDEICYKWSEWHNVEQLFLSRLAMHKTIYTHRKAKAIELMVVDALVEADNVLGFSQGIHDPQQFVKLDDSILRRIEDHEDERMRAAQTIIERLRERQIYVFVNEVVVPSPLDKHWVAPTESEICGYWHANGQVQLRPDQVVVNVNRINWAMKDKNPLDHVKWFHHFDDTTCFAVDSKKKTNLLTANFQETMLRVYSKDRDPRVIAALNTAVERYCRAAFGGQVAMATPCHGKQPPEVVAQLRLNALQQSVLKRPAESLAGPSQVGSNSLPSDSQPDVVKPQAKRRKSLGPAMEEAAGEGPYN